MLERARAKAHYVSEMITASRRISENPVVSALYFSLPQARIRLPFHMSGRRFVARPVDRVAVVELALRDEYPMLPDLLAGRRAPVIVDMGANIGLFSLRSLCLAPDSVVHSFEPSPDTYDVLLSNVRLHPEFQWRSHQLAAWGSDALVPFSASAASTGSKVRGDEDAIPVPGVSLETVLDEVIGERRVDVMKIDVEGAEEQFICAGRDQLGRIDSLIVEVHPDECRADQVMQAISSSFPHLYQVSARDSAKPVYWATRRPAPGQKEIAA